MYYVCYLYNSQNKSPGDIRKIFGIVYDLSPEEEEQFRKETAYFGELFLIIREFSDLVPPSMDSPTKNYLFQTSHFLQVMIAKRLISSFASWIFRTKLSQLSSTN